MTHFLAFTPRTLAAMAFITVGLTALPGPPAEDAIRTVEHQWLDAEYHADTVLLKQVLLPEYRDVSWKGVRTREDLVAAAAKRGGKTPEPPYGTPEVQIHGTMALVTSHAPGGTIYGVDVLVYQNGGWHGIYSQATLMNHKP